MEGPARLVNKGFNVGYMRSQTDLRALLARLDNHVAGEAAHGERVAVYAVATGDGLGLPDEDLEKLRFAGALHDIGKLAVPAEVITKTGQLEGSEVLALRRHAAAAAEILTGTAFEDLIPIIAAHHERHDGLGYPLGLQGNSIPLLSRIIAVSETFDALTHDTRWREPLRDEQAIAEVRRCAGSQFDVSVAQAFLDAQPLIQPL